VIGRYFVMSAPRRHLPGRGAGRTGALFEMSEHIGEPARTDGAGLMGLAETIDRGLKGLLEGIEHFNGIVLAIDVLIVFMSVVFRYFLHHPLDWVEEVASALMTIMIFAGSAASLERKSHVGLVAVIKVLFPVGWLPVFERVSAWITAAVSFGILTSGILLWQDSLGQTTPLGLTKAIYFLPLTVGGALMVLYSVAGALRGPTGLVLKSGIAVAAITGIPFLLSSYAPDYAIPPMVLLLATFFGSLIIGVPIAFALAYGALLYFTSNVDMPILVYSQQMLSGGSSFVLLAIPFFILAGIAMEINGMSSRLIELLVRMMGRMRGGLNVIMVVATAMFSGISGSKLADIAAVGSILLPAVRRTKQDPNNAAGLLACTAVMAETIPPCINIIIFGFVANVSIGGLFLAGLVPAAFLALGLIIVSIIFGTKVDPTTAFEKPRPLLPLIGGAMVALLMVAMIGRGVTSGIATSTEISAFAVVYAFVVGGIAFRELSFAKVMRLLVRASSMTSGIMFIMAAAMSVSFALTIEQVPQQISEALVGLGQSQGPGVFMLIAVVLMVAFGAVLEGAPALVIFGPLLTPIAVQLGINPLHFGVIAVLAMGLGLFSPPIGLGLFATCAITNTDMASVVRPMAKYLLVLVVGLIALIFVPQLSLWLPQSYGF
jgi:tripartite ATP-independent transporter DctM subunit